MLGGRGGGHDMGVGHGYHCECARFPVQPGVHILCRLSRLTSSAVCTAVGVPFCGVVPG